jgi:phage shock protein C
MAKKTKIKRLLRGSKKESMIGGVCAGIANYFEVDPTIVRLLWVLLTIMSVGVGFFGYLALWIIMPEE